MSQEVNNHHVQQFRDNLICLAQQKGSKFRGKILERETTGKFDHFDRLASTAVRKRTTRHASTPLMDVAHSRRRCILDTYDWADLIDERDKVRMLINPQSKYQMNAAYAFGRQIDEVIYDAMIGNSTAIDSDDASSNVALPSGQIVDEDFGAANSNLTFEKLRETLRIFMTNNVDLEDPNNELFLALNASAHDALLAETEIQSSDYNSTRVLVDGKLKYFMGFNIFHYEPIKSSETDIYKAVAFTKSSTGLCVGNSPFFKGSEESTKCYSYQIYGEMDLGAVRVEEEKVVQVECFQS